MTTPHRPARTRAVAAAAVVPTVGVVLFAAAAPAVAAPVCADGWTEVAPGVCSLTVTQSGTVTVPAGVTHLEALLVGGGAGANNAYYEYVPGGGQPVQSGYGLTGAGGDVTYVDDVAVSGSVQVVIGAGGPTSYGDGYPSGYGSWIPGATDGGETTLVAGGVTSSAGGGTEVQEVTAPALPSAFVAAGAGTVSLWPAFSGETAVAGSGALGFSEAVCPAPGPAPAANSGRGADGVCWNDSYQATTPAAGGSGVVILRYALADVVTPTPTPTPSAPTLAATGADGSAPLAALASLAALGGVAALSARRRAAER